MNAMMRTWVCMLFITLLINCKTVNNQQEAGSGLAKKVVLKLAPGPNNPRNSEGDFITLKDGKILFIYSHFSGTSGSDFGNAYLASRYSTDNGKTWSGEDQLVVKSPLSPASIARIPSTGDLLLVWNNNDGSNPQLKGKRTPFTLAISKDEGKTWEHTKTIEDDPDGWYCYTAIHFAGKDVLLGHCAGRRSEGTGLAITHATRLSLDRIYK